MLSQLSPEPGLRTPGVCAMQRDICDMETGAKRINLHTSSLKIEDSKRVFHMTVSLSAAHIQTLRVSADHTICNVL